ncbi:MAG: gluconate 2-dehydrogenase subunit 3 family protein [Gemmatimonadetes bacterium]|nr:gluconate 2-dehydrogenase subunit 3 family protein [Gemmatimonadota bacterium]
MDRRDLVRWLSGFAAAGWMAPLPGAERVRLAELLPRSGGAAAFTPAQAALVATLADVIIPRTDTPGALDVEVPGFIARLTTDWYSDEEATQLRRGLDAIDALARARFGGTVLSLSEPNRTALLESLDTATGQPGSAEHTFARIKSLTVYGYFTSERVQTEVLKTEIVPGRFDGCIPIPG